ncbi:MAG: hypothetical protein K6F69_04535 [Treponema sp.]|nr:hypothetical protein [Treponema sp.]
MPFEKKKKYKSAEDYVQKSIYLDENDRYQKECLELLSLCGHKQAKFLGLMAHDFIQKNGINLEMLDKNSFKDFLKLYELQVNNGITPQFMPMYGMMPQMMMPMQNQMMSMPVKEEKKEIKKTKQNIVSIDESDNFISKEDMDDMNAALAAFGV